MSDLLLSCGILRYVKLSKFNIQAYISGDKYHLFIWWDVTIELCTAKELRMTHINLFMAALHKIMPINKISPREHNNKLRMLIPRDILNIVRVKYGPSGAINDSATM